MATKNAIKSVSLLVSDWATFRADTVGVAKNYWWYSGHHLLSKSYHLIRPCYSFPVGVLTVLYHIYVRATDKESSLVLLSTFLSLECFHHWNYNINFDTQEVLWAHWALTYRGTFRPWLLPSRLLHSAGQQRYHCQTLSMSSWSSTPQHRLTP